jgi:hypothetical protein
MYSHCREWLLIGLVHLKNCSIGPPDKNPTKDYANDSKNQFYQRESQMQISSQPKIRENYGFPFELKHNITTSIQQWLSVSFNDHIELVIVPDQ